MDTSISFIILCLINFVSPDASGGGSSGGEMEQRMTLGLGGPYPYNVTINHLSPRSVEVIWDCKSQSLLDKYEVTLKPLEASYRVIETVPYNTCYLLMDKLEPDTNYQVSVTSISGRVRKRSSSVIFRTFPEDYRDEDSLEDLGGESISLEPPRRPEGKLPGVRGNDRLKVPRVRFVEISLVGMALVLWAGAIVLFFHRWGKIRMLLPYQPAYKEMERSASVCVNCSMTPHHQCCRLHQPQNQQLLQYGPQGECGGGGGQEGELNIKGSHRGSIPLIHTASSPNRPPRRHQSFITFDLSDRREGGSRMGGGFRRGGGRTWQKSKSAEQLEHHPKDHTHNPIPFEEEDYTPSTTDF